MNKMIIAFVLSLMIPVSAFALDLTSMSDSELQTLFVQLNKEMILRSSSETDKLLEGNTGKHYISLDSLRLSKDEDGNNVIVLDMTFTNGSEESKTALLAVDVFVYQNGIEASRAYNVENVSSGNSIKKIRPGATISFSSGYVLDNLTDPIEIEIKESFSFSKEMLYGMFNLPQ